MFDYQISAATAETRREALFAEAEASRLAKASRKTRTRPPKRGRSRDRVRVWLEYRPAARAFSGAR